MNDIGGGGEDGLYRPRSVLALINAGAAPGFARAGAELGHAGRRGRGGGGRNANPAGLGQNLLLARPSCGKGGFPGGGLIGRWEDLAGAEGRFQAGGRRP